MLQAPGNLAVEAGRGTNVRWSLQSQNTPRNCISVLLYFSYFFNWAKIISSNWTSSWQPAILKRVTMMDECWRGTDKASPTFLTLCQFSPATEPHIHSYSSLSTFLGLLSPDPDPSLHGFPPIIPIFPKHFLHSPVRGLCLCLCSLGAILAAWSAKPLSSSICQAQITPQGSAYARATNHASLF